MTEEKCSSAYKHNEKLECSKHFTIKRVICATLTVDVHGFVLLIATEDLIQHPTRSSQVSHQECC